MDALRDDVMASPWKQASGRTLPLAAPFSDCPPALAGNFLGKKETPPCRTLLSG